MTGLVAAVALLGTVIPASDASAATDPVPVVAAHLASLARPGASSTAFLTTTGDRISCASPTACLAVGADVGSSGNQFPVAEALRGNAWKSVTVKAPKGAVSTALTGVSCKAATYCLVVGEWGDKTGTTHPAAWTWNGTALTPVAPPPVGGFLIYNLNAVSCVAVKSCIAIGTAYGYSTDNVQLIWSWNGKTWARKSATPPGKQGDALLTAAHCFSLTSCVVAGMTESLYGPSSEGVVLATWNGKAFTPQQAGAVSLDFGLATDVWCFSPSHCIMTGLNVSTGKTFTQTGFAEVWNGKSWTATTWAGPKGSTVAGLFGVSCTSAASCIAVGGAGTQKVMHAAALSYNGTKWSVLRVPSAGSGLFSDFEGVSCPKIARCVAIGNYGDPSATNGKPLAGYWNGSAWKLKAA